MKEKPQTILWDLGELDRCYLLDAHDILFLFTFTFVGATRCYSLPTKQLIFDQPEQINMLMKNQVFIQTDSKRNYVYLTAEILDFVWRQS